MTYVCLCVQWDVKPYAVNHMDHGSVIRIATKI